MTDLINHPLAQKAHVFALAAHEAVGQKRKYTGEVYVTHTMKVAQARAACAGATLEEVVACILHDVVEDTAITIELVAQEFGEAVARIVKGMTDVSRPEDGVRKVRKALDNQHLAEQCLSTKANKLHDIDDNVKDIAKNDPGFARVYLPEKRTQMIDGKLREANPDFYDGLMDWIENEIERLK